MFCHIIENEFNVSVLVVALLFSGRRGSYLFCPVCVREPDESAQATWTVHVHTVNMEIIRGKQGNSSVYHQNGFYFYHNKTVNGTDYYRCIEWRRGCPVKANVKNDGQFNQTFQHNHNADPSRAAVMTERLDLIQYARRLDVATVQDVFHDHMM